MSKHQQQYLDAETEAGKKLATWVKAEAEGPFKQEIALLKFQLSEAAKNGQASLVRDLCSCLNQLEKSRLSQRLILGEMFTLEQARLLREQVISAVVDEMKIHFPDGEWQEIVENIAERIADAEHAAIERAKAEAPKRITLK